MNPPRDTMTSGFSTRDNIEVNSSGSTATIAPEAFIAWAIAAAAAPAPAA
ncbi:MAG: hypothetical protein U9P14_12670 [Gemmatimonadota bacterium]|nr:hypothetical protein [Gemmatimonadota bacterium]